MDLPRVVELYESVSVLDHHLVDAPVAPEEALQVTVARGAGHVAHEHARGSHGRGHEVTGWRSTTEQKG